MTKPINRRDLFAVLTNLVTEQDIQLDIDWASEAPWGRLIPLAEMHKVTAALPARLRDLGVWDRIPAEVAGFLDAVAELNTERNEGLALQCLTTLDQLHQADIEAIPLKGLAYNLMGLFKDEPGQRLTVDLDVLVRPEQAEKAQNVLISAGYEPAPEHDTDARQYHNLPRLKPAMELQLPGSIEVHFRVGGDDVDALLPVSRVFENAQTINVSGQSVLVLSLVDLLDHAVMHSAISHGHARRRTLRLRDVIDIHRLWTAAVAQGGSVSDLKIVTNTPASRYFGACLLIAGHPIESLGTIGASSAKFLAQIMRRQSLPERAKLESSLLANAQLLFQDPSRLLSKFLRTSFYQAARSTLKSPNV